MYVGAYTYQGLAYISRIRIIEFVYSWANVSVTVVTFSSSSIQ